jgi:hypothetical protein
LARRAVELHPAATQLTALMNAFATRVVDSGGWGRSPKWIDGIDPWQGHDRASGKLQSVGGVGYSLQQFLHSNRTRTVLVSKRTHEEESLATTTAMAATGDHVGDEIFGDVLFGLLQDEIPPQTISGDRFSDMMLGSFW